MENSVLNADMTAAPPKAAALDAQSKKRIGTAALALRMISAEEKHLLPLREVQREVARAYDREPPDSEEDLRNDGMAWAANVDWGGMERGVDDAVEKLFNLATAPETLCQFFCEDTAQGVDDAMRVLADEFTRLLNEWRSWRYELEQMLFYRVAFGLGIFYFPQPNGWHFRALHPGNLITPRYAELNPDQWQWCALRVEMDIVELIQKFNARDKAKAAGWDLGNVAKAIEKLAKNGGEDFAQKFNDAKFFTQDLGGADCAFAAENSGTISGYIFFVREWNGKISEALLIDDAEVGFLFYDASRHEKMSDVLAIFPNSLGQGILRRTRGYGIKMLPFYDAENRLMNHVLDVVWLSSNLMLKGDHGDINRLQDEMVIGAITQVPAGVEVMQQSFSNPASGLVQVRRELLAMQSGATRAAGGLTDVNRDVEKTAAEARMRYQENKALENVAVARFYQQLSEFYRVLWQKINNGKASEHDSGMKQAKEALKRADERGCPKALQKKIKRVEARTVFGNGDPVNQFIAMMDILQFYGQMSEGGKKKFARDLVAARLGSYQIADEYLGLAGVDDEALLQQHRARSENADFQSSDVAIMPTGKDNHLLHMGEHTVFAEETLAQMDRGEIEPLKAYKTLSRAQAHVGVNDEAQIVGSHSAMLQQDAMAQKSGVADDFRRRWMQIVNRKRQLEQHLGEQQKQQQAQQMEEMRNPRLSVKEQEAALTEQTRRQLMQQESAAKIAQMQQETQLKEEVALRELDINEKVRLRKLELEYGIKAA